MALIKRQKTEVLKRLSIRIDEKVMDELTAYSDYLESSKDYVIAEAIKYIILRDKEYGRNLPTNPPTNVGRVSQRNGARKSVSRAATETE